MIFCALADGEKGLHAEIRIISYSSSCILPIAPLISNNHPIAGSEWVVIVLCCCWFLQWSLCLQWKSTKLCKGKEIILRFRPRLISTCMVWYTASLLLKFIKKGFNIEKQHSLFQINFCQFFGKINFYKTNSKTSCLFHSLVMLTVVKPFLEF